MVLFIANIKHVLHFLLLSWLMIVEYLYVLLQEIEGVIGGKNDSKVRFFSENHFKLCQRLVWYVLGTLLSLENGS